MKKKNDNSPIFSILDEFVYTPESVYSFIDLGISTMGTRHIAVFFRHVHSGTTLHIDKDSQVPINKYISLYDIHNDKNELYGYLFIVKDSNSYKLTEKTLFYGKQNDNASIEFTLFPYINEKNHVFVYKNNEDSVLVNISNIIGNEFIVLDV